MIINPNGLKKQSDKIMERLEKNIQKKLRDFEVEPPAALWSSIESRLDKKDAIIAGHRRRRILAVAAAILMFLVSASALLLNQFGVLVEQTAQETAAPSPQPTADTDAEESQASSAVADIPVSEPFIARQSPVTKEPSSASQENIPLTALADTGKEPETPDFIEQVQIADVATRVILQSLHAETASLVAFKPEIAEIRTQIPAIADAAEENDIPGRMEIALASSDQTALSAFSLSTYFAPQQSYRFQNRNTPNPMQSLESEIMTFATGLHVNYKINNRWELQSGLGYNRIGQRVNDIATFSHPSLMPLYTNDGAMISDHPQSMSTSMGGIVFTDQSFYFADIKSSRIITLKGSYDESIVNLLNKTGTGLIQHFEYLELPVNVRYKFWQKGFNMYAKAGFSASYLMSGDVFLSEQTNKAPIGKVVGISTLNFSGMAGMVFSYPVTNRVNLSLEPTASMFITPMGNVKHLTRETHPYTWSVLMGVSYDL
ncbi:MAG: anti-sigma factor [Bacteroidetes bacterium]|nr:MAG: anti-sigma factor [Bacteroidota bacterium]